ncbi:MAG: hypothetical protein SH856_00400 [Flavobacteriales bacterium]|nr:hypothetical protein [Flavobacteriales bacterium]
MIQDRGNKVPGWVSFFNVSEYHAFIKIVEAYFYNRNTPIRIEGGVVHATHPVHGEQSLGLGNISQSCRQSPQSKWPLLIKEHFGSMTEAYQAHHDLMAQIENLDYAMKFLCVRVYHISHFEQVGVATCITRELADDLLEVLVFDFPSSVQNVVRALSDKWNFPEQELFEIGLMNASAKYQYRISKQPIRDEQLWFVTGEHFFTANIALELNKYPQLVGIHGSLVILPNRHAALFYPIESIKLVEAITALIPVAMSMYRAGPGSLSDQLYLYRNNKFTRLPYTMTDQIEFFPPEEFATLLKVLVPGIVDEE